MNKKMRANLPKRKLGPAMALISLLPALCTAGRLIAATPAPLVPTTLPAGWEQIDERLVFLTVRLSSVEASLQAINKAIKVTGYQQSVKTSDAGAYRHSNEIMDRKGGGPKPWDEFYGRTAEKFFYHPVDPNTFYINPVPISQRPPQLDYIYRANADEQQRAEDEAAALGGKIDKLLERRRQLEAEQSALWCEISFQAVASRDLSMKPLYRFGLKLAASGPDDADHLEAATAVCDFVRGIDQSMSDAEHDVESNPAQVFERWPVTVQGLRRTLDDQLAKAGSLSFDVGDPTTPVGKASACAKRLNDLGTNALDSYRLALDGDAAEDDQRKDTFRGLLQDNLLSSAETVLTMDQYALDLAKGWNLRPDVNKQLAQAPTGPSSDSNASPLPVPDRPPSAPPPQPAIAFGDKPITDVKLTSSPESAQSPARENSNTVGLNPSEPLSVPDTIRRATALRGMGWNAEAARVASENSSEVAQTVSDAPELGTICRQAAIEYADSCCAFQNGLLAQETLDLLKSDVFSSPGLTPRIAQIRKLRDIGPPATIPAD